MEKKGDLDGALADYDQAIGLNPKNAIAYSNRGIARGRKGDLNGAMADYNQSIRLNPRYANAYKDRGNAKRKKGDLQGANADFKQASKLGLKKASTQWRRRIEGKALRRTVLRVNKNDVLRIPPWRIDR